MVFNFCCNCFSSCWLAPNDRKSISCCFRRLILVSASNLFHHPIAIIIVIATLFYLLILQILHLFLAQLHTHLSSSLQHRTRNLQEDELTVFRRVLLGGEAIEDHRPAQIISTVNGEMNTYSRQRRNNSSECSFVQFGGRSKILSSYSSAIRQHPPSSVRV